MSRSYKKHYCHQWACGEDKPFRQVYNRARRRKNAQIEKACEIYYKDLKRVFHPYEKISSCYGDVCHIDEGYWGSPEKWVIGDFAKNDSEYPYDSNTCIGCSWSDNCWDTYQGFIDMWEESPEDHFCNNRVDYSVRYSDKWSWPSDGGTYYQGDLNTVRKEFDTDVFGLSVYSQDSIWDKYKKARRFVSKGKEGRKRWGYYFSDWDWFDFLFLTNKIPLSLRGSKDLIEWLRAHQEEIITSFFKKRLLKKD